MISVVVPAFNAEKSVGRTIAAILRQTKPASEIVVVNDGSTDATRKVAAGIIGDSRIRIIDQRNGGAAAARNRGAREARNEIVAFCDADDTWDPEFLETITGLYEAFPHAAVFATSYRIVPPDRPSYDARLRRISFSGRQGMFENYFEVAAISDPPIQSSTVALKRQALFSVGGFPEEIVSGEDLLTWARLAAKYQIAYNRRPHSTFYCPARSDFGRTSAGSEEVGRELAKLSTQVAGAQVPGVRRYVARWNEMRAVVALGQKNLGSARRHTLKPSPNSARTFRLTALGCLCRLPDNLALQIFGLVRALR